MSDKPIYVTQPLLPELTEFIPYLEQIWENKQLTNGGSMHREFEDQLAAYLGVEHVALFNNGTIALLTALKALRITGEVITTPYSFVATAHSLLWNGLKPIFVDIDPETLNLDPNKIEAAITAETTAIMPVHCYGNPCDVEAIQVIADNYNLKVIYDAAHCFAVKDEGGSILRHGDLSTLSFHATKVFNTFEGGAIICPDAKIKKRIDQLKNFGFVDEVTVVASGINGKMSEINAAFGLLQLKHIDGALSQRQSIANRYTAAFKKVAGIEIVKQLARTVCNNAYYAIRVQDDYPLNRNELYEKLKESNIHARRYFYPLISEFPMYRGIPSANSSNLNHATEISQEILCLPIYPALHPEEQDRVIRIIQGVD